MKSILINILILVFAAVLILNCSKKESGNVQNKEQSVEKNNLSYQPVKLQKNLDQYIVKSKIVKLRRGPGKNFEEIKSLKQNSVLIYVDKVETKDEGIWFLVQTKSNTDSIPVSEGFISSLHLEKIKQDVK